jgi:hypothetical protein
MNSNQTIDTAITESIDHNANVKVEADPAAVLYAKLISDDYAELDDGSLDVWGTTEAGCDWRLTVIAV